MNPNSELDPELDALLQTLRYTEPRDPQLVARARDTFLAEATRIAPPVSFSRRSRLDEWKANFKTFWFTKQKEKNPMFNLVMTLVLAFGVIFGSGATVVAAAQNALPDAPLYPVKAWSEDLQFGWATDPQTEFDLALQFSARRAEETRVMLATGEVVPAPVMTRFESQQQQALQFAANLPDDQAKTAFAQVRDQARQQEQAMAQLQLDDPTCDQLRDRLQTMLQTQAQAAQTGLDDPDRLRDQLRQRDRLHLETPTTVPSETDPVTLTGSNPWTTGTPTPGSSYGPGVSQNPWTDETPIPGSGYGPGPGDGDCGDCTPAPHNYQPAEPPQSQPGNGSNTDPAPQPGNGNTDAPAPQPDNGNSGSPTSQSDSGKKP